MTIDERLEALTHNLELHAGFQADAEKRQADAEKRQADANKRHDDAIARIDRRLDRAIRLSVLDARRQRNRNIEFDEKMTQLAAALQGLIDAMRRGGNGN